MARSNRVTNRFNGKSYNVVTSSFPPLSFWRTVVFEMGFLGLSKTTPLLVVVSENKENASSMHLRIMEVVEALSESAWRMPDELINRTVFERGKPGWAESVAQIRDTFLSGAFGAPPAVYSPGKISPISKPAEAAGGPISAAREIAQGAEMAARQPTEKTEPSLLVITEETIQLANYGSLKIFSKLLRELVPDQDRAGSPLTRMQFMALVSAGLRERTTFEEDLRAVVQETGAQLVEDKPGPSPEFRTILMTRENERLADVGCRAAFGVSLERLLAILEADKSILSRAEFAALARLGQTHQNAAMTIASQEASFKLGARAADSGSRKFSNKPDSPPRETSAPFALAETIITKSVYCAAGMKNMIEGENSTRMYVDCFLEFVFFFAHIANVLIFRPQGPGEAKGRLLLNKLGSQLADAAFGVVAELEGEPEGEFRGNFYRVLNETEMEYSNCETLLATRNEERTAAEIIATGKTRKGRINQLADRVARVITGSPLSVVVSERTKDLAVDALNTPPQLAECVQAASAQLG